VTDLASAPDDALRATDVGRRWDDRYASPGYSFGTEPNDFLAAMADRIPRGRVLSLGEGEGRNAVYLARRGYDVLGVDASAVGLAKARELAAAAGVPIGTEVADLAQYEIALDGWEGIVSIFCHLRPEVRQRIHHQIVRGLKPGGVYMYEAYTPKQLEYGTGGPPDRELLVTLADAKRELAGLEFVIAQETVREVVEGCRHVGHGAVVQVLAVRPGPGTNR
jgi:SAM-dependent methyltransferase